MNEIAIIKSLITTLKDYNIYCDEMPFNENEGVYYVIDTIQDGVYKDTYNLEIHIVGIDKINCIIKSENILSLLNKVKLTNDSRIIKKNVCRNYIKDDKEHHFILEFYIVKIN